MFFLLQQANKQEVAINIPIWSSRVPCALGRSCDRSITQVRWFYQHSAFRVHCPVIVFCGRQSRPSTVLQNCRQSDADGQQLLLHRRPWPEQSVCIHARSPPLAPNPSIKPTNIFFFFLQYRPCLIQPILYYLQSYIFDVG
jgi:hypothetical protein